MLEKRKQITIPLKQKTSNHNGIFGFWNTRPTFPITSKTHFSD